MKRTYAKPSMTVERFLANVTVATCEASEEYDPVHVTCLIKSGDVDGVFYSGGCSYVASSDNLVYLNGHQYLYWYGHTSGKPDAGGETAEGVYYGERLITELTKAGVSTKQGIHAGLASTEVISIINSSL